MLAESSEIMHKAIEKLKYVSSDADIRFQFEQRQKDMFDYYAEIKANREEGRAEGRAESIIKIAKSMLKNKMDINEISKYTGLTIEQLEEL